MSNWMLTAYPKGSGLRTVPIQNWFVWSKWGVFAPQISGYAGECVNNALCRYALWRMIACM